MNDEEVRAKLVRLEASHRSLVAISITAIAVAVVSIYLQLRPRHELRVTSNDGAKAVVIEPDAISIETDRHTAVRLDARHGSASLALSDPNRNYVRVGHGEWTEIDKLEALDAGTSSIRLGDLSVALGSSPIGRGVAVMSPAPSDRLASLRIDSSGASLSLVGGADAGTLIAVADERRTVLDVRGAPEGEASVWIADRAGSVVLAPDAGTRH